MRMRANVSVAGPKAGAATRVAGAVPLKHSMPAAPHATPAISRDGGRAAVA
jgi:hypothetical protein